MKFQSFTDEQKRDLKLSNRYDDGRIRDRIKVLRITEEKIKPENGGSYSKLADLQTRTLDTHI